MNDDSPRPGAEDGATTDRKVWSTPTLTAVAADEAAVGGAPGIADVAVYS